LAPLRAVSRAIDAQPARTPTLSRDDVPGELLQLTRAVDALVGTLADALARERRFTADAAHELRHPLSVLQLELDLVAGATDAADRSIPRGVDRSSVAADEVRVRGSAGLLGIALHNLVDNAIGHGRSPGRVEVAVRGNGGQAELVVEDDGPGLPDGQAGRLGERFLRSSGGGSGLGLSIVHAVVVLHAGSLAVERSTPGGARVVVRLPRIPG